jgi:hypothetical protein
MFVLFVVKIQINGYNMLLFFGGRVGWGWGTPYLVLILPQRILSDVVFRTVAML